MNRAGLALILGAAFVGFIELLGHHSIATPLPFFLLSIGLVAGGLAPDSGFSPEGDTHPWGPLSTSLAYAVNIAIYSGIAYLVLTLVRRRLRASR
ncbi:MAG: hypothetical protein JO121_14240 [Deltaproteobacteria bacterium]|nr:hypothetical protein [Deltaproteobacteria bacterium]